jgi:hypothetical protein
VNNVQYGSTQVTNTTLLEKLGTSGLTLNNVYINMNPFWNTDMARVDIFSMTITSTV